MTQGKIAMCTWSYLNKLLVQDMCFSIAYKATDPKHNGYRLFGVKKGSFRIILASTTLDRRAAI